MATYSRKLKDASGNYISPAVRSASVYMENDEALSLLTYFPVGAIYQSTNEASPASMFGGSWEQIQGRFLLGSNSAHTVSSTGGEETHKLTQNEMPSHGHIIHTITVAYWKYSEDSWGDLSRAPSGSGNREDTTNHAYADVTGGDQAHNNMPPYYTVNIWRRTA